ncbi:transcriptional regulator [Chromatiales bacterium (ex Bugula neritina AB1)]|nr:transcriptional regulator [Chromatiales bacterium (ex Bugula neritina AB1)]
MNPAATTGESQQTDSEAFAVLVGARVREARQRHGIVRKKLSEISGVSLRYLAQLENGGGNISVALLHKIAIALGQPVEWFVCAEDPWSSESMQVAELYRAASPMEQQQVRAVLQPRRLADQKAQRVCLIGLRGAGKSTLGALAGQSSALDFVELNSEISTLCGLPINELINFYGQEGYRDLEHQALERIVESRSRVLLAAAGGIVAEPDTFVYLCTHFYTIWLKAAPEEHMQRVRAQGDERPMVGNPKAMEQLTAILASREVLYARADTHVDTSGKTVQESHRDIARVIDGFINK